MDTSIALDTAYRGMMSGFSTQTSTLQALVPLRDASSMDRDTWEQVLAQMNGQLTDIESMLSTINAHLDSELACVHAANELGGIMEQQHEYIQMVHSQLPAEFIQMTEQEQEQSQAEEDGAKKKGKSKKKKSGKQQRKHKRSASSSSYASSMSAEEAQYEETTENSGGSGSSGAYAGNDSEDMAPQPWLVEDGLASIRKVTKKELESVPSHMRGRLNLQKLNNAVEDLNSIIKARYSVMTTHFNRLTNDQLRRYKEYHEQETSEVEGTHFFAQDDFKKNKCSHMKMDSTGRYCLQVLRHLNRIKQISTGGNILFVVQH